MVLPQYHSINDLLVKQKLLMCPSAILLPVVYLMKLALPISPDFKKISASIPL